MDVFAHYHRRTVAALGRRAGEGGLPPDLDLGRFAAAPAPVGAPCDIVVDAALVYARASASLGRDPLDLARAVARDLSADPSSASVEVAGPGFVNVTLRPAAILGAVASILRGGPGAAIRDGAAALPADLRSGLSLDEARAIATAEQVAALSAAAGRPLPRDGPDGSARMALGPSALRGRDRRASGTAAAGVDGVDGVACIGADAFRFAVASCRRDAVLYLDPAALSDRSRDNPAFWVPYAHARLRGVLRRAAGALPSVDLVPLALAEADLSGLTDPGETGLARLLARHAHVVSTAAAARAPQRFAMHLCDLANAVHSQWNRSKDQPQLRFVNEEERDLAKARLGLVTASALVLKSGLAILGITAPDEMR